MMGKEQGIQAQHCQAYILAIKNMAIEDLNGMLAAMIT